MIKDDVLVIGGLGYIGSALCDKLEKKKFNFTVVDNLLYGNNQINKFKSKKNIKLKDVRELDEQFIKNFKTIIFLAALSNNPISKKNQNQAYEITAKYTIKIAKICKKYSIQLIYPSSCSVYGYQDPKKVVNEKSKINPLTLYSKNKAKLENKLIKMADKNFNPIIFRPATVFGYSNSMRFDLVINMFAGMSLTKNKILLNSDGEAYRPFVDIGTLVNCFVKAINIKNKKPIIANIGYNSFNLKIIEIAKIIAKINNSKISFIKKSKNNNLFKDDLIKNNKDIRSYKVNFDYAAKLFNLKTTTKIETKIKAFFEILKIQKNFKYKFKQIKFYRLEQLHNRINNKQVNPFNLEILK